MQCGEGHRVAVQRVREGASVNAQELWKLLFGLARSRQTVEDLPKSAKRLGYLESLRYAMDGRGDPLDQMPGRIIRRLQYKRRDKSLDPPSHPNCRCVMLPLLTIPIDLAQF